MALDPSTRDLIAQIHRAPPRFVLALTGGGAEALGALLSVPGGSHSILEAVVPYHEQAFIEFLGFTPQQFCAVETAQRMAARARERARCLAPSDAVVGLGCTASLVSDRPKRGTHRLHLAVEDATQCLTYSLTLNKGERDRAGEEAVLDAILLNAMAEMGSLSDRLPVPLLEGEAILRASAASVDPLARLISGAQPTLAVGIDGQLGGIAPTVALLAGAFNPVHEGHWRMAEVAARLTGLPVAFELSIVNVDKPPLTVEEVRRRLVPFAWKAPVWLSRAPTFVQKATHFPGATFIVGADTAERIVMPRYYGNCMEAMATALAAIQARGCRFLVAGRADDAGIYRCLERVQAPDEFRTLFRDIPQCEFHVDLSSTQIRTGQMRSC